MAGTNSERELLTEGPAIILVHPQLGENIGMVARAMANFGLSELRLVNPRDGWPSEKAKSAASRADHVIDNAKLYASTEEAIADLNFVYATTARDRYGYKPVRSRQGRRQASCLAGSARGSPTRKSRSPTRSSPFPSIPPSPRSIWHRRFCSCLTSG
jgi:tRNA(Leu) C34 or U34 (ribose-2'-O)-methylase TrmL